MLFRSEPLPKLYRSYLKAAGGNYSKYLGEFHIGSLRSKTGALGFNYRHLSGSPSFKDHANATYSTNTAQLEGKYFLAHSTLDGELLYNRNAVRFYGFDTNDTIIDKAKTRQFFSDLGARFGIISTYLDSTRLNYKASVSYSDLTDHYSEIGRAHV